MFIYTQGMTKLISVADDVYAALTKLKGRESYSMIIRQLARKRTNKEQILELFGKGGIDETRVKELRGAWKRWSDRYA